MALSNIFNEPRREITESVVGIGIFIAILGPVPTIAGLLYHFGVVDSFTEGAGAVLFCMVMVGGMAVLFMTLLFATHQAGDAACNALQRRGIHLRPRNRPGDRR